MQLTTFVYISRGLCLLILSYALILEVNDPFPNWPISESTKELLVDQSSNIVCWTSIFGMACLFAPILAKCFTFCIELVMRVSSKFKASVEEHRAQMRAIEAAQQQNNLAKPPSPIVKGVLFAMGIVFILNDAIYNRPADTSLLYGACIRIIGIALFCAIGFLVDVVVLLLALLLLVAFQHYRARRQIRLQGDEELNIELPTGEMTQRDAPTVTERFTERLIQVEKYVDDTVAGGKNTPSLDSRQ
ncbi:hypothetical protein VKT23_006142 [Stygiomarasmius scandens]|uniref:Uncharacterized protein n=1 Tax=Marasmiellus scandens TaxID=2682957 RepID=A0ABR1JP96_9AGAR